MGREPTDQTPSDPARCQCPGCELEPVEGRTLCPTCEDGLHVGHCPRCRRILFSLEPPVCPGCGADLAELARPGPGPPVAPAEAPAPSKRTERLQIAFFVLVALFAAFTIVRSHPSGSATGRIEATGGPHGSFVLQPRTCLLGDHWGFDGVWVIREMEEAGHRRGFRGGLRIERDGEGRWQATLENPDVCEVFICRQRPIALEHCRVHDLFVGETTIFLRRSGHARLECAFPEGGKLDVSLEFRRCAAPPTGGDAEP